jgi:hypothetical protein
MEQVLSFWLRWIRDTADASKLLEAAEDTQLAYSVVSAF